MQIKEPVKILDVPVHPLTMQEEVSWPVMIKNCLNVMGFLPLKGTRKKQKNGWKNLQRYPLKTRK